MPSLCRTFLIMLAMTTALHAADHRQEIINGKTILTRAIHSGDISGLERARAVFRAMSEAHPNHTLALYYIAYADYRIIPLLREQPAKAMPYIDEAIASLEKAVALDDEFAEAYALLAGCYGWKINFDQRLGRELGGRAGDAMRRALELEPENPRIVLLKAISDYYTPPEYGGSRKRAQEGFQAAAALFRSRQPVAGPAPDWGRDEVHAWLGLAYMENEDWRQAQEQFDAALKISPDYGWVKYVLAPQLEGRDR